MKAADTYLNSSQWSRPSGATQDVGLHLRLFGSGSDSLLLLHGLTASNLYFGAAYDTLGNHARVIVPDLLGFGRSPRPDNVDYGADAQVDALVSALDRIDANGSLYIAAHSAGTLVALRLATRRPDWVRGVIAFGPPLYPGPERARTHVASMGWWVRMFALDTVWARTACAWMCRHRRVAARIARWLRPDLPTAIADDSVQHSWVSYSRTVRNLVLDAQPPRDLAGLKIPIVLVAGEDDPVVDLAFVRELAARYPNIQLEIWPGSHDLPLSASDRCVAAIREWVRRI